MLTEMLAAVCALLLLLLSYKYAVARPKGFPPGPPRVPLFGSYLFMLMTDFTYMHKAVLKFSEWYKSDIVGFHMGPFPVVAVHSAQGVREILMNQAYDGRPQIFVAAMRDPNMEINGIFFRDGEVWKEQRRFILRHLRDFGFGRRFSELELVIQEEIADLLDLVRNGPRHEHEKSLVRPGGYRIQLPCVLSPASVNSILYVMFNLRFARPEQANLHKLSRYTMQFQRLGDDYGTILSIMPWVRHIFPKWSSYDPMMEANRFLHTFFADIIDHHIETYDEGCDRNFIDVYIKRWREAEATGAGNLGFSREQVILALLDFSFPAISAISSQISLIIQHFMLNPEVLKRVQAEIDEVVGSGRLPTLQDRVNLHYTEATVREGLRMETLVPSDVPHMTMSDTELLGYKIPKNTIVIPSLYAYHNDKRVWGDPENFRPQRFLDHKGHLSLKQDVSFPFGGGKRLCAGETFARNMLFLLVAALCQNFNFVLGPEDKLPDLSKNLSGLIISPPDFWLQLEERK